MISGLRLFLAGACALAGLAGHGSSVRAQAAAQPVGWASVEALDRVGTTGGAGGPEVVATTYEQLVEYANGPGPLVIYIQGTITQPGNEPIRVQDHRDNDNDSGHKSFIGLGDDARIEGELRIRKGAKNIIIQNITFDGLNSIDDGVSIDGQSTSGSGPVHHIWIDHCNFTRHEDGPVDISHGADFISISWCHFYETNRVSLVGHTNDNAEEDAGHLTVTYHHNWFDHTIQRHPRVRHSRLVHAFNNFYDLDGSAEYGTVSTEMGHVLLENNYFSGVGVPFKSTSGHDSSGPGFLVARGNVFVDCGPTREENGTVPEASTFYDYTLDAADDVPELVRAGAGAGTALDQSAVVRGSWQAHE